MVMDTLSKNNAGTQYVSPTNQNMFPWLAALAAGYEKYRFRRLSYFYRSMAPTTANGLVYMAVDYDPSDTDVNDITPRTLT